MMTSHVNSHAHLWYHVWYCSIENVWRMVTEVSIYNHCARALLYISLTFYLQAEQKICYRLVYSTCEYEKRLSSYGVECEQV